jgi:TBC1 domain family member 5
VVSTIVTARLHVNCLLLKNEKKKKHFNDVIFRYKPTKDSMWSAGGDIDNSGFVRAKVSTLDELDLNRKDIILLSGAYGAEGELGIVFCERFMEHDAYSMFDGLMDRGNIVVQMVEFFLHPRLDIAQVYRLAL